MLFDDVVKSCCIMGVVVLNVQPPLLMTRAEMSPDPAAIKQIFVISASFNSQIIHLLTQLLTINYLFFD